VLFVLLFPLQSVAMMGSAAFLLVYTAVNLGHYRIRDRTGARGWIIVTSVVLCLTLFVVLSIYIVRHEPTAFIALVVALALSAAFEIAYRRIRGRTFRDLIAELG
jgi:amino acid transporter